MKKLIVILTAIISGQIAAQTLYSNGARVIINGANVQVNGSVLNKGTLDLKQTSIMVVKGDINNQGRLSNDGHVDLHGNLWSTTKIDNPVFGEWNFKGTTAQNVTSDSALIAKNIFFNNPAGFLLDVKNDVKVTNTANFVRGIVQTINTTKMRFGSSAIHTGASDTGHVKGIVAKEGLGSFSFPVGTGLRHQEVTVNSTSNPTSIDIEYKSGDAGSGLFGISGAQATPLQSYNNLEYWKFTSGGAQGDVTLRHDAFNALSISTLSDVRVGRQTSPGPVWSNQGGTATGNNSDATVQSLSSTLDGNFTLGIVKKDISVTVINPSGKTSICFKDTLVINARRILALNEFPTTTSFSISPASAAIKVNDTTFKLFPSTTTQFVLTGTDQNNLTGIVNFNLVVNQLPNVVAAIKDPIIVNGVALNVWPKDLTMELMASGASNYSWSPSTFTIGNTTSSNLVATPASHITYTVLGTDVNGCKNTASVPVRVFLVKTENLNSCASILWRKRTITNTGAYFDTFMASNVDTAFVLNFTSNAVNVGIGFENGKLAAKCMDCQYQWYACKPDGTYTPIENAKSRILSITTIGTYTVEISNGFCTAKSPCISNSSSAIVANDEFEGISVFPNPFVDVISVKLAKDPVNAYIQIVDLNGRVAASHRVIKSAETNINLSGLAQGAYFIQIVFENQDKKMYYTKIIKE